MEILCSSRCQDFKIFSSIQVRKKSSHSETPYRRNFREKRKSNQMLLLSF